ncbi:MAG: flagellar export protein FliJ [Smithella sp.]|jgi:flagellar FliJ protein
MFKFKLQSVLEYRHNIEEKILNEFSDLKRILEEKKAVLKALIDERHRLMDELRNMQRSMMRADDLAALVAYVENLRLKEKEQKNIIEQASEKVEAKRKELMEALKNKKVMENLRDKHAEEYQKNMNELEQKNSDEMSVLKYGRRET